MSILKRINEYFKRRAIKQYLKTHSGWYYDAQTDRLLFNPSEETIEQIVHYAERTSE